MIEPFDVFALYLPLKQHFNPKSSYNFFKYGGNMKSITDDAYFKRKDKFFFGKLAKKFDTVDDCKICLAYNLAEEPNRWIGKIDVTPLKELKTFMQSLEYRIDKEFKIASQTIEENGIKAKDYFSFNEQKNSPPEILTDIYAEKLSLTTYLFMNYTYNLISDAIERIENDLEKEELQQVHSLQGFFDEYVSGFEKSKEFKQIIINKTKEHFKGR